MPMSFSGRRRMGNPFQQQTQYTPAPQQESGEMAALMKMLVERLGRLEQSVLNQAPDSYDPDDPEAQTPPSRSGPPPAAGQRPSAPPAQRGPRRPSPFTDGTGRFVGRSGEFGRDGPMDIYDTPDGRMYHNITTGEVRDEQGNLFASPNSGGSRPPSQSGSRPPRYGEMAPDPAPQTRPQFIDATYRQFLGRPASPEEQAGYTAFDPKQIVAVVSRSQEAQNAARTGKNAYGQPFDQELERIRPVGPERPIEGRENYNDRDHRYRGYPETPAQRPGYDYDGQPSAPAPAGQTGVYAGESGFTRDGRIRLSPNDPDAPGLMAKNPNLYVMPAPPAPVMARVDPIIDRQEEWLRPQPYAPPPPAPTFTQRTGMVSPAGASTAAPTLKAHQAMVGGQLIDFKDEEMANRFRSGI